MDKELFSLVKGKNQPHYTAINVGKVGKLRADTLSKPSGLFLLPNRVNMSMQTYQVSPTRTKGRPSLLYGEVLGTRGGGQGSRAVSILLTNGSQGHGRKLV